MRPKILIVDDDISIIKFVKANLEANGYETSIACDGKEALDTVARELPTLVLLDIMMPTVDGYEVCRQLDCLTCSLRGCPNVAHSIYEYYGR